MEQIRFLILILKDAERKMEEPEIKVNLCERVVVTGYSAVHLPTELKMRALSQFPSFLLEKCYI